MRIVRTQLCWKLVLPVLAALTVLMCVLLLLDRGTRYNVMEKSARMVERFGEGIGSSWIDEFGAKMRHDFFEKKMDLWVQRGDLSLTSVSYDWVPGDYLALSSFASDVSAFGRSNDMQILYIKSGSKVENSTNGTGMCFIYSRDEDGSRLRDYFESRANVLTIRVTE